MGENVFGEKKKSFTMEELMDFSMSGRENLGGEMSVAAYRLLQFSLKDILIQEFGNDKTIDIFRRAGFCAGEYFATRFLDPSQEFNKFVSELQRQLEVLKIGILRIEKFDEESGQIILTVSEDADCSGLPVLGETVCNYDEGFIAGILSVYTKKPYEAVEINCWATGDRVCRFDAYIKE